MTWVRMLAEFAGDQGEASEAYDPLTNRVVVRLNRCMVKGKFFDILVLMVLENTGWSSVQDCQFVHYIKQYGTIFSNWTGATHPSGPNYRTLMSGQTWSGNEFDGVARPNIGRYVDYKVFNFRNEPAIRHNPFLDMNPDDPRAQSFASVADFATSKTSIMYLGMDDANDAHSGPLSVADDNVMAGIALLPSLIMDPDDRLLCVVTFDEAFGATEYITNHVFTGMLGTDVAVKQVTSRVSHVNFAQFLADNWSVTLDEIDPSAHMYAGQNLLNLL